MKAKTFCSLAVLISLLSTFSYSQSADSNAPKTKSKSCYEIMKEQSVDGQKSKLVFSLSGGYAGLFKESSRPNGFNIQADVLYPVSEYFALNLGVNFSQFMGYHYEYNTNIYDTVYEKGIGDVGKITQINLMPGMSFGNINGNSKINYYITAGLSLGLCRHGIGNDFITSNFSGLNTYSGTHGPNYYFDYGVFASGRISYKVSDRFGIFVEPTAFSDWKDSEESNYRINGGISLNL